MDDKLIDSILQEAAYCIIGLSDNGQPYTLPMNFGFKENKLYLHSFPDGKKMEILKVNNRISFGVTIKTELIKSEKPCNWGMRYMSVLGQGYANFLNDRKHKIDALNIIMEKYDDGTSVDENFEYDDATIDSTAVIMVEIRSLSGKISGFEI